MPRPSPTRETARAPPCRRHDSSTAFNDNKMSSRHFLHTDRGAQRTATTESTSQASPPIPHRRRAMYSALIDSRQDNTCITIAEVLLAGPIENEKACRLALATHSAGAKAYHPLRTSEACSRPYPPISCAPSVSEPTATLVHDASHQSDSTWKGMTRRPRAQGIYPGPSLHTGH